jgi:hypothetical protein
MPDLLVSRTIPYTCQFASPELVQDFVQGQRPIETDPRWAEYGAATPDEYAHWALRACGVVAVKMAVEGLLNRPARPVMDWIQAGLELDGYLTELRPDRPDGPVEKGWRHTALARLAENCGLEAWLAARLAPDDLARHIQSECVVIASVSSELGEEQGPITRSTGHLVVVYGVALDEQGRMDAAILHNPSGCTPSLRQGARIPRSRFEPGFSGRGIIIQRRQNTGKAPRQPG